MKKPMMILKSMSAVVAMVAFGVTSTAEAHHSATYITDFSRKIEVKGVLSMVRFANPHCEFQVDGKDANGKPVVWSFEGPPPVFYRHAGLKKEDFAKHVGEEVTVTTFPTRDGSPRGFFKKVTYKDGTFFEMDITPDK